MVVLDGCYFIRLVVFWLGYAKVSNDLKALTNHSIWLVIATMKDSVLMWIYLCQQDGLFNR
ncbi:hypothetical protein BPUTEOSOX_293 [thiotrophic endosymbiont of Bathymodiolus puteoserpentis (Logatchev)]|nr:hypothetical protein BPUTEOSOX_293 [thiotrophic endosymbiont of Bathymodiolus puteoserpentis (Logatchev)]